MTRSRKMTFGRYDYAAFLTFISYAAGSVVLPIALLMLSRDLGFSLEEGGLAAGGALTLGRTLTIVLAMLYCGFAAGRWGMRQTYGWSVLLMGLGMGLCAFSPNYSFLFITLTLSGIGAGIIEGLATPFVQELHPKESGRYINFSHSFWSIGVVLTVLISGALLALGVSWRIVVGGTAATALLPALIVLWPESKGREYPDHPERLHWRTVMEQAKCIVALPRFWLFFTAMFLAGGGETCLAFWSASYIQINFQTTAWSGGVGTACFAGGMVVSRLGWGYLIKQHQLKQLLVYSGLGGLVVTIFLPSLTGLWTLFGVLFFAGIAIAPFWPSLQSYSADRLPKCDTTMLFILLSCAGIPGCGLFTWVMGYIANQGVGLGKAFYLVPLCFLLLTILVGYDWYRSKNDVCDNSSTAT
jgi:MFS family permease